MRKIDEIIIHCTATVEGKDYHVADVDKWHKARGWKGIGYHYLITLDGTIEKGRPEAEVGAHTVGHNAHSIGICYVGGVDKYMKTKDTRTDAQKEAMWELLRQLLIKYPNANIHGHNFYSTKSCPCFCVESEYKTINLK